MSIQILGEYSGIRGVILEYLGPIFSEKLPNLNTQVCIFYNIYICTLSYLYIYIPLSSVSFEIYQLEYSK